MSAKHSFSETTDQHDEWGDNVSDSSDGVADGSDSSLCGLVMPIAAIGEHSAQHWVDVRAILSESISEAGLTPRLVSDDRETGIIQKRIVQNLYNNDLIICDVSSKNPNVMFELGLRLAFDRPTVVVKDDLTTYSFDTSSLEHLTYPADLRYQDILSFKASLLEKILAAINGNNENSFLKSFGTFHVARIEQEPSSEITLLAEEVRAMRQEIKSADTARQELEIRDNRLFVTFSESVNDEGIVTLLAEPHGLRFAVPNDFVHKTSRVLQLLRLPDGGLKMLVEGKANADKVKREICQFLV